MGTERFWKEPDIQEAAHRAVTCQVEIEDEGRVWNSAKASMMVSASQELQNLLQLPMQAEGALTESTVDG